MHTTLRHALLKGLAIGASAAAACSVFPASAQSYTWRAAKIGAGGYVCEIIAQPGRIAPTDIGGDYRFNASNDTWVPLVDGLTPGRNAYDFVEAIAIATKTFGTVYAATSSVRGVIVGTLSS